jgi:putative GTP pyrophosphokinase
MTKNDNVSTIKKDDFLRQYNFTNDDFEKTELDWSVLAQIYEHHTERIDELKSTADYILQRLQLVSAIHSLKVRIKEAEHLVAKIIRKKIENPELTFDLTCYRERITDLIGIRALHLFKDDWRTIHEFVTGNWDMLEPPTANVRAGDPDTLIKAFTDKKCVVKEHPFGYRSIHYLIKSQPAKCTHFAELQVRTIFEEGWSEIDHRVRYPRHSDNPYLAHFLGIFNRLAGSADEMGTFIKALSVHLQEQAEAVKVRDQQIASQETELKQLVSQLKIGAEEKETLEKQIDALRKSSIYSGGALPSFVADNAWLAQGVNFIDLSNVGGIAVRAASPYILQPKICAQCGKNENLLAALDTSVLGGQFHTCLSCNRDLCNECWPHYIPDTVATTTALNLSKCPKCVKEGK